MRRLLLCTLLLTLLAACAGTPTPAPLIHVQLAMGYIPDVQFAPFYVAAEKGYFKGQGIEIEFVTMFENDSVPLLGTNELQFALVSAEQIIQARAQGLPVKYVMKWWDKYPIAVVSKAGLDIKSPADLKGRKVGIPGLYGASYIGWQALLNAEGLPQDTAQLEAIGFTQAEAVAAGQVDAAVVYANNEPVKLADAGTPVNVIYVADYVQLASNGLATNEQTIKDRPEFVRGMIAAMLKGMADTMNDPDAAVEIAKKYVESLAQGDPATLATARKVLVASIGMWETANPGHSDKARWETTHAILLDMGLITSPLDVEQAFTNEFVK